MIYLFGTYSLDADRCELRRAGEMVVIQPQVLSVLLYLIEHRVRIVGRDELSGAVWDGRAVSDSTLNSRMTFVRHAIGDDGKGQRLIRSFPNKGYRFVAPVQEQFADVECDTSRKMHPAVLIGSAESRPSIIVLPFLNLSGDPEQAPFLDGLIEDLTTSLAQFPQLQVMAISQASDGDGNRGHFARYVVNGTFRKTASRARVTARLVDAQTSAYLWAGRIDAELGNVIDVQQRISTELIGAILPKLELNEIQGAGRAIAGNLDAYTCTMRGLGSLYRWSATGIDAALRHFQQAMDINPEFAPAYAMASYCYVQRQSYGWICDRAAETAEAVRLARGAAELGRDDAFALARAAHTLSALGGDVEGAIVMSEQAIRLNPQLALARYVSGWLNLFAGRPESGLEQLQHARDLSPNHPLVFKINAAIAYAHFFLGRFETASQSAAAALRERPDYLTALRVGAASCALSGRSTEAQAQIARIRKLDPAVRVSTLETLAPFHRGCDFDRWAGALSLAGLPD